MREEVERRKRKDEEEEKEIDEKEEKIEEKESKSEKRKRGRPKGSKKGKKEEIDVDEERLGNFLSAIFSIAAERLGQHWELSEGEKIILVPATYEFLKQYGASIVKHMALIGFVSSVAIVMIPRILTTVQMIRKKKETINEIKTE